MKKQNSNILLVDEHKVVRSSLILLLSKYFDNITFYEAFNFTEAINILKTNSIDIVITDLEIPLNDRYNLIKKISTLFPKINTIVFSMHDSSLDYIKAIEAGAKAHISKSSKDESNLIFELKKLMVPTLIK